MVAKSKKETTDRNSVGNSRQELRCGTSVVTHLKDLVVDAVDQGVGPHPDIQVGVTEPLHCLVHVGD